MIQFRYLQKISSVLLSSLVLGLSITKPVRAEWDEWFADTEISFLAQDNINHAFDDAETKSDQTWGAFASVGRTYHFSGFTRMDISAQFDGRIHHEFSELNQLNTGLKLGIRHKFGLGSYQPWIKGFVSSGYISSRSKLREGYQTYAGITLGKPLHDRIDMVLSYHFEHRESSNTQTIAPRKLKARGFSPSVSSSVYDIEGHTVELQFNAQLTQHWFLTVGYAFRDGDIVSTTKPSLASQHRRVVDAVVIDDALSGWAYRADGITHTYSIDASYTLMKGDASINLGYQHIEGHADPFTYRNNLFRLNFLYNF